VRRHTRPLPELWPFWKDRAAAGAHPFQFTLPHDVERIVTGLRSYDRDAWAAAFSAAAAPYQNDAEDAEQNGDTASARRNYLCAYGYYRLARYPTTNSDAKLAAYRQSQELLLRAARYLTIPIERVEIPFRGRTGEGDRVVAYLRVPDADRRLPILIVSGGIDTFKEDVPRDGVLGRRIATLALDIPGVGDAPLPGSPYAERMFDAVLDWIGRQPRFDAERVGYWGASTGGVLGGQNRAHASGSVGVWSATAAASITHSSPAGSKKRSGASIPSNLLRQWHTHSGATRSTSGSNTPRNSHCCGKASWISPAPTSWWSTVCTTRCFRSATAICSSSMGCPNPPASSTRHTWATPPPPNR
jgi:hypothetical protein